MPSNMGLFTPTRVYTSSEPLPGVVGTIQRFQGRGYVLVYNAGAATLAAGDVAGTYDSSGTTYGSVSGTAATILDCSDGTTTRSLVAGIVLASIITGSYGWLWYDGYGTHAITTDGNVAKGHGLICADGAVLATPNTTAATAHWMQFGQALADDATTTLSKAILGGPGMFRWGLGNA